MLCYAYVRCGWQRCVSSQAIRQVQVAVRCIYYTYNTTYTHSHIYILIHAYILHLDEWDAEDDDGDQIEGESVKFEIDPAKWYTGELKPKVRLILPVHTRFTLLEINVYHDSDLPGGGRARRDPGLDPSQQPDPPDSDQQHLPPAEGDGQDDPHGAVAAARRGVGHQVLLQLDSAGIACVPIQG